MAFKVNMPGAGNLYIEAKAAKIASAVMLDVSKKIQEVLLAAEDNLRSSIAESMKLEMASPSEGTVSKARTSDQLPRILISEGPRAPSGMGTCGYMRGSLDMADLSKLARHTSIKGSSRQATTRREAAVTPKGEPSPRYLCAERQVSEASIRSSSSGSGRSSGMALGNALGRFADKVSGGAYRTGSSCSEARTEALAQLVTTAGSSNPDHDTNQGTHLADQPATSSMLPSSIKRPDVAPDPTVENMYPATGGRLFTIRSTSSNVEDWLGTLPPPSSP